MGKALSDFRRHPQYLVPGATMDAHRRLGPGQPAELSVDFQMIAAWMVSGCRVPEGLWVGVRVEEGTGSPLAQVQLIRTPEFDSYAVSHLCSLLPCATVTMAALSLPDWLCDHNGYIWEHHDNREELSG